ncbi:MAG: hypothetical protein RI885_843 [Actinomycetota bacterium]
MIDQPLRRALDRPLSAIAAALDRPGITPDGLTLSGLGLGLASASTAALQWWWPAVTLWLLSRVIDGLDGSLARRRRSAAVSDSSAGTTGEAGGYLDIVCDFVVYGATVFGVGVGATAGFDAPWWPFALVLLAYYVNGAAFLAFSSIAERTGRTLDDGRSLSFLGRIAEGTETIVVHSLWMLLPMFAWQLAIVWAAFVAVSAVQRMVVGYRSLR